MRAVVRRERFELVELLDAVSGHHHRDLELPELRVLQIIHGASSLGVTAFTPDPITGRGVRTIDGDLDVEIVQRRQSSSRDWINTRPIGGELHAHLLINGVFDQLKEVAADHWFASTDIDVKDLHRGDFIDERYRFTRREFHGVSSA